MTSFNTSLKRTITLIFFVFPISFSHADDGPGGDKGIGPAKEVKLDKLDLDLAKRGKELFTAKCSACHKLPERYVGPALAGVTKRRKPEWIMNMILNPAQMIEQDPVAKELLAEYMTQMAFQNVNLEESRALLEYFRHYDEKGEIADKKADDKSKKDTKTKEKKK